MGIRFPLTREAPVLDSVKKQIAEAATELDTALMLRSYTNTTRVYRTARTRSVIARGKDRRAGSLPALAVPATGSVLFHPPPPALGAAFY